MFKPKYGYIPRNLAIEGRPELDIFPLNVLFAQYGVRSGRIVSGSAVYEPDFESYKREHGVCSMVYRNQRGDDSWLLITYDESRAWYEGSKWVNGDCVGTRWQRDWNKFFGEFTGLLGLTNGEECEFKVVGNVIPATRPG